MSLSYILLAAIVFFITLFSSNTHAGSPISGFNPALLSKSADTYFFDGRTFWADNALPLQAIFFDKWGGPFTPEVINRSDNYWKTNVGITHDQWRFAGFYRGELFMETNRDTITILRMVNREQELPVGKSFDIALNAHGFSAAGVELSRGIDLSKLANGLNAGFTARFLKGEKIQEGAITGIVTATGPTTYDFNLQLDYFYDENLVYNRRNAISGAGGGYSIDIGLQYILSNSVTAEILFRDILGRIYWRNVPYTIAGATSNVKDYDEDGYQIYHPTISGWEIYKDFTQKVIRKTDLAISYDKEPFAITPTVNFIGNRPLYWIEFTYKIKNDLPINLGYNFNYGTFSMGTTFKKVVVDIYTNDLDFSRAMAVGLRVSTQHYW